MPDKYTKPNTNQTVMIKRRNLDPKNYRVIKETYSSLWLLDLRIKKVKILYKYN